MAEIVAFNPSAAKPRRMTDVTGKPLGELVFFTGVRYERLTLSAVGNPKPEPTPAKPRLKSKA